MKLQLKMPNNTFSVKTTNDPINAVQSSQSSTPIADRFVPRSLTNEPAIKVVLHAPMPNLELFQRNSHVGLEERIVTAGAVNWGLISSPSPSLVLGLTIGGSAAMGAAALLCVFGKCCKVQRRDAAQDVEHVGQAYPLVAVNTPMEQPPVQRPPAAFTD